MKITRKQLRKLIQEAKLTSAFQDPMTTLTDHLDDLIRAKDSSELKKTLEKLQKLVDHYSDAEILQ